MENYFPQTVEIHFSTELVEDNISVEFGRPLADEFTLRVQHYFKL